MSRYLFDFSPYEKKTLLEHHRLVLIDHSVLLLVQAQAYHLTMRLHSSLLCLFVFLGGITAAPQQLFAPRGGSKPKDVLARNIANTSTLKDTSGIKPFPQTIKDAGPLELFTQTIKDARRHLAAAGVARCVSIFIMYPVDTIKVRNVYYPIFFSKCDGIELPRTKCWWCLLWELK
jgi:hypothetical protein